MPDVRTDLGTAYWYTGNADEAIASYEKALAIRPNHPGTLFNLGIVKWQGKKDPKGAVVVWEKLLQTNPDYPQKDQVQMLIERAKMHGRQRVNAALCARACLSHVIAPPETKLAQSSSRGFYLRGGAAACHRLKAGSGSMAARERGAEAPPSPNARFRHTPPFQRRL